MAITREQFIAWQSEILDEFFGLTLGEEDLRRDFEQLALETYDCLVAGPKAYKGAFYPYPSAFNFVDYDRGAGAAVPDTIRDRWRSWKAQYPHLLERHPALELRDAIHTISESHDRSSWPTEEAERLIRRWVDAGDWEPLPFDDRDDIATPQFYTRLRELQQAIGGWLYRDREKNRVVFVHD